jgi:hypothetical protein
MNLPIMNPPIKVVHKKAAVRTARGLPVIRAPPLRTRVAVLLRRKMAKRAKTDSQALQAVFHRPVLPAKPANTHTRAACGQASVFLLCQILTQFMTGLYFYRLDDRGRHTADITR